MDYITILRSKKGSHNIAVQCVKSNLNIPETLDTTKYEYRKIRNRFKSTATVCLNFLEVYNFTYIKLITIFHIQKCISVFHLMKNPNKF